MSLAQLALVSSLCSVLAPTVATQVSSTCVYYEEPKTSPGGCFTNSTTVNCVTWYCCHHYHDTLTWHICRSGGVDQKGVATQANYQARVETCGPTQGACTPGSWAACTHFERDCRTSECPTPP